MDSGRLTTRQASYFDAWRGGSAIAVVIGHGFQIFDPWPTSGYISTGAVMVFFVLSGYFIHKSLALNLARKTPTQFVAARVNRIVPPFAFSLILTIVLWAIAPAVFASGSREFLLPTARHEFSLAGLLPTALFLNGFLGPSLSANGPVWSLSFEIWYYALAFIFAFGWRRAAVAVYVLLTIANPKFGILGIAWLLGVGISAYQGQLPRLRWPMVLPALLLPAILTSKPNELLTLTWSLSVAIAFASHMALMTEKQPPQIPFLPSTAKWSYTLYIVHFPLLLFVYGVTHERAMMLPAMVGIGVFAALSARIVEDVRLWPRGRSLRLEPTSLSSR